MRQLYIIGIGSGDPEHLTVQAISALNEVDVFFVADKGADTDELTEMRAEICRIYSTEREYRIVQIADPPRDRRSFLTSEQYNAAVLDWHEARAAAWESAMLDELEPGETPGFLVWGDPAFYDSVVRIVERVKARGALKFRHHVIPGISSVQLLAAAHRIVLNRIGEPIHITTGRRLREQGQGPHEPTGLPVGLDDVVVMLDGELVCQHFTEPGLEIYWGAYPRFVG
ncbi:precorrin-6A synthase [Nakamurella sp. UYEF19]|uniref:precorrin-6A synthase (deacetylating) n=1 Tax=Nakamurella sp. UYEF19 TaxID=1756392 RepID=UPI0033956F68